ncbi:MAG TPA: zinc-binding dehydrogenase, partial [Acidimicrobiales bacterium]|nr:zinc-binding dehydrogenase [Acidimicrobiales bacterium]
MRESGERLVATLRGDEDARRWMVAGPWLATLTDLYGQHPGFRVYNQAVAEVVAALRPARGATPLRVLEVGAGTGGATGHVLDRLAGAPVEYLATDVSPYFVKMLRHRFGDRPGFRAAALDVEDPPPALGPFDVVIAANVVHATADLRRTLAGLRDQLAPGGTLVLMEALGRAPWFDLLFGQFDGWWRHADADLRADHPLLDLRTWLEVLGAAGFEVAAVADDLGHRDTDPLQAVLVATVARPAPRPRPPRRWLVLSDGRGVGPELAAGLREAGDTCVLAWPGPAYRRYGGDGAELDPASVGDWARLLADAGPVDGVLHLWALDAPDEPDAGRPLPFLATTCGSVAALFAALDASGSTAGTLWLVTAGAQPAGGDDGSSAGLSQAPLWGLGRVVRSERGGGRCRLVDLGAGCPDDDVAALLAELVGAGAEDDGAAGDPEEVAFRSGRRLARRLDAAVHAPAGDRAPHPVPRSPAEATFRLAVGRPGALDSLVLREVAPAEPGPGEVAVRLRAAALNYRDVLVALGLPFAAGGDDPASAPLGWEGAGVVEALGDGVTGLEQGDRVMVAAANALASRVVTRAGYAIPMPAGLGFEDAATLPVAFLTAIYALDRRARLAAGERVLIHSASGGVGLAAVQVARLAGAEVLATAGTPEKRAYLESLGIEHVMDSRSLDFGSEVLRRTGGEGVDVVLNTLAGEAAACGVGVLRPFGRFVEIGKRDIYEGGRLDLAPFRNNLSALALDLQPLFDGQPKLVGSILR